MSLDFNNSLHKSKQNTLFNIVSPSVVHEDDTPISKYITNKKIYIPDTEWHNLNALYSPQDIIDFFVKEIVEKRNLDIPLYEINEKEAENSFVKLCKHTPNPLIKQKINIKSASYKYDISDECINEPIVYNKASNYFHQEGRFKASGSGHPSPYEMWYTDKVKGVLRALYTLEKYDRIATKELQTCVRLRGYVCSQFNVGVAKSIYTMFNAKNVLDFSSGWGDRLCGFYASKNTKSYIGIDPNTSLHPLYNKQVEMYQKFVPNKTTKFICDGAENVLLDKDSVDLVFTSPPYFDCEKYTDESTQSYKKFDNIDLWLEGFLFKALQNAYHALQTGGHLVINIADTNKGQIKICDRMNDYIESLGCKYVKAISMKMSRRPNLIVNGSNKADGDVFVEPIWIWEKI